MSTEKQREQAKKYEQSAKGKALRKKINKKYKESAKGKEWLESPACKAAQAKASKKYFNTVKGRAAANLTQARQRAQKEGAYVELSEEENESIRNLYIHKHFLNEITGIKHEVDHIQSYKHGGTHCRANLQILTESEHIAKSREHDQNSIAVVVEGIAYHSMTEAAKALGCHRVTVGDRIQSTNPKFSGWQRGTL